MKLTPSERKQIREESEIYRFDLSDFSAASAGQKWQGRVAALLDELEEERAKNILANSSAGWCAPMDIAEVWDSEIDKEYYRKQARRELYGEGE